MSGGGLSYDRIIEECEELRRWQYLIAALLWLPTLSGGLNIMSYTFAGFSPPHRCSLPCQDDTTVELANLTWYRSLLQQENNLLSDCQFYEYLGGEETEESEGCQADMFNTSHLTNCHGYVFDRSVFQETLVTKFELVCSDSWKKGFIGMVYMIGLFIGSYVIGFASDKFGRKITMMTSLLFLILGGSLAGLMPTYPLYVCCYVVASIAGYGMFVCPFLLTVELLPAEKKTFISMMTNFPFVIGMSLMCLIAWGSKDYQLMHLLGYLPLVVFFPLWFILPESPRWLLAKGRLDQFRKEIEFGARLTGVKLEGSLLTAGLEMEEVKTAKLLPEKEGQDEPREMTEVGFVDILKSKTLLPILLVNYVNWAVINLCYYGLTMNSVNLNGNIFINSLLGVLIEAPGYLIAMLTMDRFGRKPILVLCQLVSGCACISAGFVPTNLPVLTSVLSCLGKLGTSAAFALIYLYSAEMFPTEVRNTSLGTCSMVARLGGFVAPYIASLGSYERSGYVPFLIFGVATLLGGSTAIILPETLGRDLPVTIEEAEQLVHRHRNSNSQDTPS